jgi:hypothetical protein
MFFLLLFATTIAVGAGFTVVRRKRKAQAGAAD